MADELNLVSSVTVTSDVSYVDLTGIDATYDIYRVVVHNARPNNTSGGGWRMRWLVSSSPETGNNHFTQWASHTGAADFQWYGLATDYRYSGNDLMYIGDGSSDTGESFNGVIDLYKTHDSDSEGRFLVIMATLGEFKTQVSADVEKEKPLTKNVDGVVSELSGEEYDQLILDRANELFYQQENGWIEDRLQAYGSLNSQLDMQYWDQVNGTTVWKDHVAKVKSDYPKPE